MKNSFKSFVLSAAAIFGFAACQQEIAPEKPATATHTVTFVAETPQTKTTVDISDGATAKFDWSKSDENRFTVYEINGETITPATDVVGNLDADNKMTIIAEFVGTATENTSYVAVLNAASIENQISAGTYDENTDVLVSKPVKAWDSETAVLLNFRREIAVAKMTLKGLAEGDVVNNVTIKSDKPLAGTYSVSDWTEPSNVINITTEVTANGEGHAEVWFTCIPQESAQFTVEAATAGGKTYTKEFAKPITLTQGNVKAFGVALESTNPAPEDNEYHLVESDLVDWRGHYLVAYSKEVFMDGSLEGGKNGVGKANSAISPADALSTDEKTITAEWGDNHYVTIEAINDSDLSKGYVIKTHSETTPYFYNTKNENGMSAIANKFTAATYPITIEFTNSSDVKIKLGGEASGAVLRYNATDKMFRYYKNGTQSAIYLYKRASDYFTRVAVESIALDKTNLELAAGRTETLTATIAPANATNKAVKWSSSNTAIATVENGVVTAVAEGTAIITATSEENPAITATCEVSVTAASTGGGPVLVYTLDTTNSATKGKDNAYDKAEDITVNDIIWNVTGNATMNPWRIGGKNLTNVNREVYTKTAYPVALQKIDLTVGAASSVTVNSCKLVYSTDSTFSNAKEVAFTFKASSTMPIIGDFPANCYYKFVFNVTITNSSNKFIEFKTVELYQ